MTDGDGVRRRTRVPALRGTSPGPNDAREYRSAGRERIELRRSRGAKRTSQRTLQTETPPSRGTPSSPVEVIKSGCRKYGVQGGKLLEC